MTPVTHPSATPGVASAVAESTDRRTTRLLLIAAVIVALALRLTLYITEVQEPRSGLEHGYIDTAATLASGLGALMPATGAIPPDVTTFMKQREASGGRVDSGHPYPPDPKGWLPATVHPPGYSLLFLGLYKLLNYTSTIKLLHMVQAAADALTCLFVYLFLSNLFGTRFGMTGAWLYAVLPASMVLTLRLLPDSFACFFAAAILALATRASNGRFRYALLTGAVIGIACQFRAEFLTWSVIVIAAAAISKTSILSKFRSAALILAAEFMVLTPWIVWSHHATGHWLVSASDDGGTMYQALGEDPRNPWGITLQDEWIEADAVKHGFPSAWTPEANAFYRSHFFQAIRSHPASFLKLILVQRLPVALVPPFNTGNVDPNGFSLFDFRRKLGLTRWGAMLRYPGVIVRNMWPSILMAMLSFALAVCVPVVTIAYRREPGRVAFIVIPWLFTVLTLSVIKQIEPRNMASNIVPGVSAATVLFTRSSAGSRSFSRAA